MENNFERNIAQLKINLQNSGNEVSQFRSDIDYQKMLIEAATSEEEKNNLQRNLRRMERSLNNANKQYEQDLRALGK